jgi:hypothetical protein
MPFIELRDPWRSFLTELDALLPGPIELHCLGGFVVSEFYGLSRATADIDVLVVRQSVDLKTLVTLGGRDSALTAKHGLYIDVVTVAAVPENYQERLVDYEVTGLRHLRLRALERHDLALAKLSRNLDRDIEDVKRLAVGPGLDVDVLRRRYNDELRPQLARPEREDLTLDLWIEIIEELQGIG